MRGFWWDEGIFWGIGFDWLYRTQFQLKGGTSFVSETLIGGKVFVVGMNQFFSPQEPGNTEKRL